jgi:hypothetical protein
VGRDGLPPTRPLRDRAGPHRALAGRTAEPAAAAVRGPVARGVPVVRGPHRHQDRKRVPATATPTRSTPLSRRSRSGWSSTPST